MTANPPAAPARKRSPHIVWLIVLGALAAALAVVHWWAANDGLYPASYVGYVTGANAWARLPNIGLLGWAWFYAGTAALCWVSAIVVHAVVHALVSRGTPAPPSPSQ